MTVRSRVLQIVALTVAIGGLLALLFGGAGAAGATDKPAISRLPGAPSVPSLPTAIAPKAVKPSTAPSHPLTVTLPGLATVSVNLPDLPAVLGGGRKSSGDKINPSEPTPTTQPTPGSADPVPPTASAPSQPATSPATQPKVAQPRRTRAASRPAATRSPDAAAPIRAVGHRAHHDRPATAAKKPTASQPVAEAFEGMLRTGLPVWLLVSIVVMCGGGTVLVVRAAGRRTRTEAR